MVLQVFTNAWRVNTWRHAQRGNPVWLSNARKLQQFRCIHRAGGHDDLPFTLREAQISVFHKPHARSAAIFQNHGAHLCTGQNPQIAAAHRWPQEPFGRGPAHAAGLVDLKKARAFIVAIVEIGPWHDPEFLRTVLHRPQNVPTNPLGLYLPFAACAMHLAIACMMVLRALEIGQHIIPTPARIAQLPPAIIICGLPTHIDHAIHSGAAA